MAAATPPKSSDSWITDKRIPVASLEEFPAAADRVVAALGDKVELLGFGEALHGGEEILRMRNRIFQQLVEKHGYTAIAIESSFPRARLVNAYIHGRGPADYKDLLDTGFGNGMGQLEANRDLVEWMRAYNLDPTHATKLNFYGFDIPSGNAGIASPGKVLSFVVDYLGTADAERAESFRQNIRKHLGDDAAWENSAVYMDPSKSIALSPSAAALRVETEELIAELRSRRPELVAAGGDDAYREALRHAEIARELLNFHAAMGSRKPGQSPAVVLGTRDASMADNLVYIADRERPRGKVLVFAHNSHLQRGLASWPGQKYWGTDDDCRWWPAGAHLAEILGPRYAVIASAVGVSPDNGIGEPEPGTLEAKLAASGHDTLLVPIRDADFGEVPTRSGSMKNPTYVPLDAKAATNFDWIAWFANTTYNLGGPPLQTWDAKPDQEQP
ncbi:MAG: erythromycin esterase family protein [Chthoniobacterales bacterium]|nr:erythromycin esterase family protein [Chthoniobacterales bacterium]